MKEFQDLLRKHTQKCTFNFLKVNLILLVWLEEGGGVTHFRSVEEIKTKITLLEAKSRTLAQTWEEEISLSLDQTSHTAH